jgi:hypothetical protein
MHWVDPEHLPATRSTVTHLLVNPHGDLDGLLLRNGLEVHVPPHLSPALEGRIRVGDRVQVNGVRVRGQSLLVAVAIHPAQGQPVIDEGPGAAKKKPKKERAKGQRWGYGGTVQRLVHGPRGDVHGALLEDGTLLRFPPHTSRRYAKLFEVGRSVDVEGTWLNTAHGGVLDVDHVAASGKPLQPIG